MKFSDLEKHAAEAEAARDAALLERTVALETARASEERARAMVTAATRARDEAEDERKRASSARVASETAEEEIRQLLDGWWRDVYLTYLPAMTKTSAVTPEEAAALAGRAADAAVALVSARRAATAAAQLGVVANPDLDDDAAYDAALDDA